MLSIAKPTFSLLITLVLGCTTGLFSGGCAKEAATSAPTETRKFTQAEADKQIEGIKSSKSIPESAKPGIIGGIQARVGK